MGLGMEAGWSAPPLSQELYASAYALRRSLSSMHDVGMAWVGQRAATIAAAGVGSCGVSVLSVGSGQGDVDVHVIKSILDATRQDGRLLRYVAVDPSHAQCELFRALLQEPPCRARRRRGSAWNSARSGGRPAKAARRRLSTWYCSCRCCTISRT